MCITKFIKKESQNAIQMNPNYLSVKSIIVVIVSVSIWSPPPPSPSSPPSPYKCYKITKYLASFDPSTTLCTFSCVPIAHVASAVSSPAVVVILCMIKMGVILKLVRGLEVSANTAGLFCLNTVSITEIYY